MEYRITRTHRCRLRAKWFPGKSDARFESSFVHLNANAPVRTNANRASGDVRLPGDIKPTAIEVKVGLPVLSFGDRSDESPGESEVQRQVVCHTPIVLNEGAEQFPAPSGSTTKEGLVMNSASDLTEQEIGRSVAGQHKIDEEPVLEGVGFNIHLIGAEPHTDADIVFAANHIEGVRDQENVRPTLKWGKATVTEGHVVWHQSRGQTAAHAVFCRLIYDSRGRVRTFGVQVCAQDSDVCGLAASISKRQNVVEDAVKPCRKLVDIVVGENVGFRDSRVAPVVADVLIAGESSLFRETGRTTRNIVVRLIVAKAGEYGILA